MKDIKQYGFNSLLVHYGGEKDPNGSATVPIYQTSTFSFKSAEDGAKCFAGEEDGYIYTRLANPTTRALERQIAVLEHGYDAVVVSSGMAAVSTVYMALLNAGDHMIYSSDVYGSSRVLMEQHMSRFGVESTYVNTADLEQVKKVIRPNTKLIYVETPANPTMDITDIEECAKIAHSIGAVLVVDNTFCSPYLQNPLTIGADVCLHSMTKFINGHADVVGGVIISKDKPLYDKLRLMMIEMGCNMDPHQAYLVIRGLKTLALRVERAQANAQKVAQFLENHPKVAWVKYPGLASFKQRDLVEKQMKGTGTMISFCLNGGIDAGRVLMNNVQMCLLAVSLGGIETLIQHPASMTHSNM